MEPGAPDPLEKTLLPYYRQGHRNGPIVVQAWAGGIEQTRAQLPAVRIGRRWFSSLWLIPLGAVALVLSIAVVREMAHHSWFQEFSTRYPGTSTHYVAAVHNGFPWWLRWQHFLNLLFMMFIIRAGLQILADHPRLYLNSGSRPDTEWFRLRGPVPPERRDSNDADNVWTAKEDSVTLPKHLGIPGFRHSVGLARWWHFSFDLLWLVNGLLFYVLLLSTGEWKRLIPNSFDVFPNALSTALQYLSLELPENAGFSTYNALQLLAYFITVFIAAPVALVTGLLQAPAFAGRLGTGAGVLASPLTISHPRAVQRVGRVMVGGLKSAVEKTNPIAKYSDSDISPYFWTNGERPESDKYVQLKAGGWADYRLRIDGLVENPVELTYGQLLAMSRTEQITQHFCIQGWSGVAKWAGVPMREICELVSPAPTARWVVFYSFAEGAVGGRYYDCHPIASMFHEQTILAYEMNGEPLNESHGAPLRLRDEVELGFKQVKWIEAIEFVESFAHLGAGQGGYNEDQEFYGYRMPI